MYTHLFVDVLRHSHWVGAELSLVLSRESGGFSGNAGGGNLGNSGH